MSRVRRKARFWKKHIVCHADSGLTAVKYCAQNNLRSSTFYKWKRRLAQESEKNLPLPSRQNSDSQPQISLPEQPEQISFAQIEVPLPTATYCFDGIKINFPCGVSVRLSPTTNEPSLRSLLLVLRETSPC